MESGNSKTKYSFRPISHKNPQTKGEEKQTPHRGGGNTLDPSRILDTKGKAGNCPKPRAKKTRGQSLSKSGQKERGISKKRKWIGYANETVCQRRKPKGGPKVRC